jgi:LeuA allosteric (dimerisation) domain
MDRVIVFDTTLRDGEQGTLVSGKGASTDVIEASARAYLSALNRTAQASSQRMKEVGP